MKVRFIRDDGEKLAVGGSSGLVNGGTDDWFPAKTLRTSSFTYADADGGQMVKQHYDPWPITFSGYIVRPSTAATTATRNELLRFFATNHYYTAVFTDCDGVEMSAPSGGYIYYAGGYEYTGEINQVPTIDVNSTQPVAPIWTVTGQATNPSITNLTTNTSMSYNGTIANGQTLVVDCLNQTAMIGTADVSRYLSGDWMTLAVGTNQLRYETTSDSDTKSSKLSWNGVIW